MPVHELSEAIVQPHLGPEERHKTLMVQSVCHPAPLPAGVLLNRLSVRDKSNFPQGANLPGGAGCTPKQLPSKNNSCLCKEVFISAHKSVFASRINACLRSRAPFAGRSHLDERVRR